MACPQAPADESAHEAIYANAAEMIRKSILDVTESSSVEVPRNLRLITEGEQSDEEFQGNLQVVLDTFERVRRLPQSARDLLALIVNRGTTVNPALYKEEIEIPTAVLAGIADCSIAELKDAMTAMEFEELAWWDDDSYPPRVVIGNSTRGIGWPLFAEINGALANPKDSARIRRIFRDLKLSELDA